MTQEDYLNLVTSEFRDKPVFISTLSLNLEAPIQVQNLLTAMMTIVFDLDLAVGNQLDIIGQWVGISRNVNVPISGVYFTWDGDYTVGWDYGSWQPSSQPTEVTVLPDDSYRVVLKAKIAANHWDGTTDGAYKVWDALFTTFTILIQDNQNMTYDLAIVGGIVDSLTLALITGGYIALKPEGVRLAGVYAAIDSGPVFAWDVDAPLLQGWDEGSWVRELPTT